MKTYICEICGDAYLGEDRPTHCPFCGAKKEFIKNGFEARPIVNEAIEVTEKTRENLMKTLELEMEATSIYQCMAEKSESYEIKAMYKRLAKVESEHASIVTKILKIKKPEIATLICADSKVENFEKTISLEDKASKLYLQFAKEAEEPLVRKFFGALVIVEKEHIDLINNYLK